MSLKDYYKLLGLEPTATKTEVKKRYRKLAMKLHPDKNPDPLAHQVFVKITEAYEAITEGKVPQKRNYSSQKTQEDVVFKRGSQEFTKEEFEERIRKAKEFAKRKKILEEERFYRKFFASKLYRYHPYIALVYILFSLVLLADRLAYHEVETADFHLVQRQSYYEVYQYNGKRLEVSSKEKPYFGPLVEEIHVRESFIFKIPRYVEFQMKVATPSERKVMYGWLKARRTYHDLFWFYFAIYFMPVTSFLFRKKKGIGDFFVKWNTGVPFFMFYIFLVQWIYSY